MKTQASREFVVFEAIGIECCSTNNGPRQGLYLHRIPRKLVHDNREFWLVKSSRDVLDEETEGVLFLLRGHFWGRVVHERERATAKEKRREEDRDHKDQAPTSQAIGTAPPFPYHHHHLNPHSLFPCYPFRMATPYWSLVVTVFKVSPLPNTPSLFRAADQSTVHPRSIHPLRHRLHSCETWHLRQEDPEGARFCDLCRVRF